MLKHNMKHKVMKAEQFSLRHALVLRRAVQDLCPLEQALDAQQRLVVLHRQLRDLPRRIRHPEKAAQKPKHATCPGWGSPCSPLKGKSKGCLQVLRGARHGAREVRWDDALKVPAGGDVLYPPPRLHAGLASRLVLWGVASDTAAALAGCVAEAMHALASLQVRSLHHAEERLTSSGAALKTRVCSTGGTSTYTADLLSALP